MSALTERLSVVLDAISGDTEAYGWTPALSSVLGGFTSDDSRTSLLLRNHQSCLSGPRSGSRSRCTAGFRAGVCQLGVIRVGL